MLAAVLRRMKSGVGQAGAGVVDHHSGARCDRNQHTVSAACKPSKRCVKNRTSCHLRISIPTLLSKIAGRRVVTCARLCIIKQESCNLG